MPKKRTAFRNRLEALAAGALGISSGVITRLLDNPRLTFEPARAFSSSSSLPSE